METAYLSLQRSGVLARRAEQACKRLAACDLCAHRCAVDRRQKASGSCQTGRQAVLASFGQHFGEEPPLVGRQGSGTIFFQHCNLHCVFCQNWDISQKSGGQMVTAGELARIMLGLQAAGCHNINLVSPSHVVAQILEALVIAAEQGLVLPLVYNTGGYDSPETLELLDGVIDIYMPDMKFADSAIARPLTGVVDYAEVNIDAVREMHRQVGDLTLSGTGIAVRGLLVRHLVLPENLAGTDKVLAFLSEEISRETYVNIMDQYRPCYQAHRHPPLDRRPSSAEMCQARRWAKGLGLHRGF